MALGADEIARREPKRHLLPRVRCEHVPVALLDDPPVGEQPPHAAIGAPVARRPGPVARRLIGTAALALRRHPWVVTLAVSLLTVGFRVRGSDTPAAEYRVWLFRRHGFVLWDDQWYGGHHLLGYSLLFPPAAGLLGVAVVGVSSCVVSTWAVTRIVRLRYGDDSPSGGHDFALLWFSVAVVGDLAVGRLPFALGGAFATLAVLQVQRDRRVTAALAATASSLASPLAGLFLLICAAAWLRTRRARQVAPLLGAGSGLLCSLAFPEGGVFPFPFMSLLPLLVVAAIGLACAPRSAVLLRRALIVYTGLALVLFVIPTPVGGNLARPVSLLAGPAAVILLRHRRRLVAALVLPLMCWQAAPLVSTFTDTGDPSAHPAYYAGLVSYVTRHDTPLGRLEIPFTRAHWEARYVAPHVPLARGWERQLDIEVNAPLYDSDLGPAAYKSWLLTRGVRFVALPDVPLDASAKREAGLLRAAQPFLREVWSDRHWRVWRVVPTPVLARGPAVLTDLGVDGFTVRFAHPGTAEVLVRYSAYWQSSSPREASGRPRSALTADGPPTSCVTRSPGGWTLVRSTLPGAVRVSAEWSVEGMFGADSTCAGSTAQAARR